MGADAHHALSASGGPVVPGADSLPPTVVPTGTVVAVVGATATGKSALALDLALALDGEIVGADASQLYRGMDVGTAKTPADRRRGVPHHLVDVLDVADSASVAAYQQQARAVFADVLARGRTPVLVGGSGLYVRAALDEMEFPPTDPAVRARLEAEADVVGSPALHERLAAADPAAAAAILPTNARRVVRALEVGEITGRPFSASMPQRGRYAVPAVQVGLRVPREVLDERTDARVAAMRRDGLTAEVAALAAGDLRAGTTAGRALGYAQLLEHLAGVVTEDAAYEATATATRAYARRQVRWFRVDTRVRWLDVGVDGAGDSERLLTQALTALHEATTTPSADLAAP